MIKDPTKLTASALKAWETRRKNKRDKQDPKTTALIVAKTTGQKRSQETKDLISQKIKEYWANRKGNQ